MKQGFVKVAAASCAVVVADVRENTRVILETIHKMEGEGAKVMVLPELALTGYTCSDLFWQSQMIDAAKEGLKEIADGTKEPDALIFVGLPWEQGGKLFNVAAVLCQGEFTFVYRVVLRLERAGIPVFSACSFRKSQETISPDGNTLKQSVFVFTRFRRYGSPS